MPTKGNLTKSERDQYDGTKNGKNPEEILQKCRKTITIGRTSVHGSIPTVDGQSPPQYSR